MKLSRTYYMILRVHILLSISVQDAESTVQDVETKDNPVNLTAGSY